VYLANVYSDEKVEMTRGAQSGLIPNKPQSKKEKEKAENHYD
jgi:hypothetical protein